jgi:hypothetical protein
MQWINARPRRTGRRGAGCRAINGDPVSAGDKEAPFGDVPRVEAAASEVNFGRPFETAGEIFAAGETVRSDMEAMEFPSCY